MHRELTLFLFPRSPFPGSGSGHDRCRSLSFRHRVSSKANELSVQADELSSYVMEDETGRSGLPRRLGAQALGAGARTRSGDVSLRAPAGSSAPGRNDPTVLVATGSETRLPERRNRAITSFP